MKPVLEMQKVCEEARLLELTEPHMPHVLAEVRCELGAT